MKALALATLIAFSASTAASAQVLRPAPPEQTQAKTVVDPNSTDPGDQMECRVEPATGSRIKGRTCHTKREWAIREGNAKDYIKTVQDRAVGCPTCQ